MLHIYIYIYIYDISRLRVKAVPFLSISHPRLKPSAVAKLCVTETQHAAVARRPTFPAAVSMQTADVLLLASHPLSMFSDNQSSWLTDGTSDVTYPPPPRKLMK